MRFTTAASFPGFFLVEKMVFGGEEKKGTLKLHKVTSCL